MQKEPLLSELVIDHSYGVEPYAFNIGAIVNRLLHPDTLIIVQRYVQPFVHSGMPVNAYNNRYLTIPLYPVENDYRTHTHYCEYELKSIGQLTKEEALTHVSWHVRKIASELL